MRVAVQEKIYASGGLRRNVDQAECSSEALEDEVHGKIEAVVVITEHRQDRRADLPDRIESCGVAEVTKVPDLVGGPEGWKRLRRELSMRICDDGDIHERSGIIERIDPKGKMRI
jgi:hypothetical protein